MLVPYRRAGVGEQLVADVIETARGRFTRLYLRTTSAAAARLYERLGFRPTPGPRHSHVLELPD